MANPSAPRPQMPPATVTRDVRLEGYKALLVQLEQQAIQREAKRGLASDGGTPLKVASMFSPSGSAAAGVTTAVAAVASTAAAPAPAPAPARAAHPPGASIYLGVGLESRVVASSARGMRALAPPPLGPASSSRSRPKNGGWRRICGPCGEATVSVNHRLENRATPTLPTAYEKDPAKK